MEGEEPPSPNPSSVFRDISNFKTPKHTTFRNPNSQSPFPHLFTASKQTSSSASSAFRRRSSVCPSSRSKAARRLKAFELEQSQSSRKAQIRKEKSLKSLSKSFSAWLNFLFENPKSCGCDLSVLTGSDPVEESGTVFPNGKRDSGIGCGVGIDGPWRSPKRQRDCSWHARKSIDADPLVFSSLQVSLQEVCSFEDLKQRMRAYLSLDSCKEVLTVMSQVAKHIDEGRLKMKAHCPIVTDVGMKEKATRVLMCYNPTWLRIGLYIVFGGDSLLPTGDVNSDQELMFLKMVIEKQFFSHAVLAKTYAYNKLVDGLYRPGYFEALGNIILKRFLLLVLVLDIAKSLSSLPIKYGIDGTDGGSPLLFTQQSNTKSSRQVIYEFLSSEVMHGEGNLLAHLVIVGYKVSYQQDPLLDYNFRITDLFEDLQDGLRLCRAIQLLQKDASILKKMVVPSDNHKKNLVNCGVAIQYLKQAGVPLSDEDGVVIVAEDIARGDKELVLSMLWNMFVHLQLPLLVNKALLFEEIGKVKGADVDYARCLTSTPLELLLEWIQEICQKYELKIENFVSLVDGKAMWCLVDYYFRNHGSSSYKNVWSVSDEESPPWARDSTDAVHNFILCQKLTTILGNFPEVLQISDILEQNGACNERSVIILLVFLSSQLIGRKHMDLQKIHKFLGCSYRSPETNRSSLDKCFLNAETPVNHDGLDGGNNEDAVRKFKVIQAWWRDMVKRNHNCAIKQTSSCVQCILPNKQRTETQRERAAKIIQSHIRGSIGRHNFLKIKAATFFLQAVVRSWLMVKTTGAVNKFGVKIFIHPCFESRTQQDIFGRYLKLMVERHSFLRLKKATMVIQRAARVWIARRRQSRRTSIMDIIPEADLVSAATVIQSHICGCTAKSRYSDMVVRYDNEHFSRENRFKDLQMEAAVKIQLAWKKFTAQKFLLYQCFAATRIQSHWRGWTMRREFVHQRKAIIEIQSGLRRLKCWRAFQQYRLATRSAIIIQSHIRGLISRREASRERHLIVLIQNRWRGWLTKREFLHKREAAVKIQSSLRCINCQKDFLCYKNAAIEIQRHVRGQVARSRLLGASFLRTAIHTGVTYQISRGCIQSLELKILLCSVLKLQRWWKRVLLLKSKTRSAIMIQCHIRAWIARREARKEERNRIVVIQSYWKGYLARKESRGQLLDLRLRVRKSAANVDNGMRLINRLVAALSDLLSFRSVSSVLHTCATLDMATQHSQKCCETLVAAGAINTLLKLVRSVSRSIPDQEVLKHALSTLSNLARYPHLAEVLIDTGDSVETVFREFLRNKDGYFIASQVLKKLFLTKKGIEAIRHQPALLKRLHSLVEDLKRRVTMEKRNVRPTVPKDTERRLKEAAELLKLITNTLEKSSMLD